MAKFLWPMLLALGTASLCLNLLEIMLNIRGATDFVRPYHYLCTIFTVAVVVGFFWPLYRGFGWMRRRGAWVLSLLFLVALLPAWAHTLPLGDRLAIHYQQLNPAFAGVAQEYGWFYMNDSGMGDLPMDWVYLFYFVRPRLWLPMMFFLFLPTFFSLHRNAGKDEG